MKLKAIISDSFLRDSMLYAFGSVLAGVFGYAFHFILGRYMSVGEYGELQSLSSLFSVLGIFGTVITYLVVRYASVFAKEKDYAANRSFLSWFAAKIHKWAALFILLAFLISPLLYTFLGLSDIWGVFIIVAATVFSLLGIFYKSILTGWKFFLTVNNINIFSAVVKLGAAGILILFSSAPSIIAFVFLISSFAGFLLARQIVFKRLYSFQQSTKKEWFDYFSHDHFDKNLLKIFMFSALLVLVGNIDIILVKGLTSAEMTGYFGAFKVLSGIILAINTAIITIVLPAACEDGYHGKPLKRGLLLKAYGLIFFVGFTGVAAYYLFPNLLIELLFRQDYLIFADQLWLFGFLALTSSFLLLEANLSYARHDFRILYVLCIIIFLMVAGVFLFHSSIQELVIAVTISTTVGYLLLFFINHKEAMFERRRS